MVYLCNSFSLMMLPREKNWSVKIEPCSLAHAKRYLAGGQPLRNDYGYRCAVGHADTAALFSTLLGHTVTPTRVHIAAEKLDRVVIGQYSGPRLPEGTVELPRGASIEWFIVTLEDCWGN